jgi:hypothetical protein
MANMNKFQRIYELDIETNDGKVINIRPPLTIEFEIVRNNLASANTGEFTIYNLNSDSRKRLFKDKFDLESWEKRANIGFRAIQFSAGYLNPGGTKMMPRIFNGDIRAAYSARERTEYHTRLECFDGGLDMAASKIAAPMKAGVTKNQLIQTLVNAYPRVEKKVISSLVGQVSTTKRGLVLFGTVAEILKELTNNKFYIDNKQAFILKDDEVIPGDYNIITADSGLIGTPRRADKFVELDLIFEPRIHVGQQIQLTAQTETVFNGVFKVTGVTHRGVISDAVSGECMTTISLLAGNAFKVVW